MKIEQLATILNTVINQEQIGESAVVSEDLTNIVDVGTAVLDYTGQSNTNFENFMGKLIDQVGKQTFVTRSYSSQAPKILKDSWEYGSILQKVRAEIPDAAENKTWALKDLANGSSIDPFVITKPDVTAKFYNSKTTFEVPITIAKRQLESAFKSPSAMNSFISMIENRIALKKTLCTDALIMRTINNLIALKLGSGNNVVDLLGDYKTATGQTSLTAAKAMTDPDFLKYAAKTMLLYKKYITEASVLYNEDGYVTFTPDENLKVVMLADFMKNMEVYLYSDTFHNEFVTLNGYQEVGYWQGTGVSNEERSTINVKATDGEAEFEVEQDGIIGVFFDDQGCAVCNEDERTTSIYNPRGEYTNFFHKWDSSFLNDTAENCIVFVVSDAITEPEDDEP